MYNSIDNRPVIRGPGIAGLFGCDVDKDDFDTLNKVPIYPGGLNVWLVARRPGSSMNISEFVEEYITDPLDTSWTTMNVVVGEIKKLPKNPDQIRINMISWGRRPLDQTLDDLTPAPNIGSNPDFYMINFMAPSDAPSTLPWPVEGCVEEADWVLSGALSDIKIGTGQRVAPITSSTTDRPVSAAEAEAFRQTSISQLQAGRQMGMSSGGLSMTTTLALLGLVGGGAYLYWQQRGARR